jgi:hypothetical protein
VTYAVDERLRALASGRWRLLEDLSGPGERDDPVDRLAIVLEPADLWSEAEVVALGERLDALDPDAELEEDAYADLWEAESARFAAELVTDEHRARLVRLLGRVRKRLPDGDFPEASRVLEAACRMFDRDEEMRDLLAATLLIYAVTDW